MINNAELKEIITLFFLNKSYFFAWLKPLKEIQIEIKTNLRIENSCDTNIYQLINYSNNKNKKLFVKLKKKKKVK
jgi:hypothetical protein